MAMSETQLKSMLKEGLSAVYVLYGEETYLVEQYARLIAKKAVGDADDAFNLHRFDGQAVTPEQIEEAVEALPLMAERTCVQVRDMDLAQHADRIIDIVRQMPDSCTLVFWQMTVQPDKKKAWKTLFEEMEKRGCVVDFARKTVGDTVKLLVDGAKRRGCVLSAEDARRLIEQAGNDLNLLLRELDKLVAIADGGTITCQLIAQVGTKNLEARVFDLSKAIISTRANQAYALLHQLLIQREEPVAVLGVLSTAFSDMYRAKIAVADGVTADSLAADFKSYKGKEFRLRNAARDAARMSVETLRNCLEILAQADAGLKLGRGDRTVLEQTVSRLIERVRREE